VGDSAVSTGRAGDARRRELAANLADVRQRLAAACARAGRDPAELTLIAVTKTWPAEDVVRLASLGLTDVGENRDQEAAPKALAVAAAGTTVAWHFVGQLQRNKCRSVVGYANLVHSVDSIRLAEALADAVRRQRDDPARHEERAGPDESGSRQLAVLVQVSVDGDPSRGGVVPAHLDEVAAAAAGADGLALRGLMAVAPMGWEPARAFAALAELAGRIRANYPGATILSAGMSGDVEEAINYGATHLRMGTALLGNRPSNL
jgi:pyridoxal phosphate enzyme (YggS family)